MSQICFVNTYPADQSYTYDQRIALLRQRKIAQTEEKAKAGGANEDDYGIIEQDEFSFRLKPNHENGSIYGYKAWSENYCRLLSEHPLYCDPLDAFVGKGFLFMERLRPKQHKWNPDYPYDDLKVIFQKYDIISGVDNCHHFTPDLQIGFDLGWGGILEQLKCEREKHDASHYEFYDAEIMVVEAIIAFLTRMANELEALSQKEENPALAENLLEMSRINGKLAAGKPETFREAVQWMCWFSMLSRTYNRGSAGGQLDEMLLPYYEADVKKGILTDEDAVFYLACLFLQDSRYFQLGGPDINGNDMTSKVSYLALEAADKINIACNLTIRVHDKMDEDFFLKSVEYLFKNKRGWPRYSSDNALVDGFVKCGYSKELARRRVAAGCHWMCIPGMEYTMNDTVKINLLRTFEVAYEEMMAEGEPSVERLFAIYEKHLKIAVDATGKGIMHHLKYQSKSQPELILNLFQHGLVEKGVNITDGGANYYNMCMDGSGIAVVADCFAALQQRIEMEKKLTYQQLHAHIQANYEDTDGEYIRQLMLHSQRYGGGNSLGDHWAVKVKDLYTDLVRSLCDKYAGINFIPGFFSWSNTILLGQSVGATPNGRKKGEPINHGANPCTGFRPDGAVTAMCNSIAAIQPGYGNTAPVQLEVDPGIGNDEEGIRKMAAMIKTIMNTGNTLLNINIIDTDMILDAHKDPFKYPDLVVRVTGFTAYFAMLSPDFRQLVVDRITSVNPRQIAEKKGDFIMITKGGQYLAMEKIDTTVTQMRSLPMCVGEIPGTATYHVTVPQNEVFLLPADPNHYNIFVLVEGECAMDNNGVHQDFAERVTFVPAPEAEMTVTARTNTQLVQIVWDITAEDIKLRADYGTEFPLIKPYATAIQYVDPNKSPKTISRMMIPHKMVPRFAIGSVESYGYDYVKPHSHPMLDQFFFSFPENNMDLIINGEKIPMDGNVMVHIPLGADHGVEVTGTDHMHYMWIDFLPDNDAGLKRLDERHKPTGTVRDLEQEDKFRDNDK